MDDAITEYRCHTLEQFVWATQSVQDLDPAEIRRIAVANYSLDRVRYMYEEYFEMLSGLWGRGWPELKPRTQLDWLNKTERIEKDQSCQAPKPEAPTAIALR